MRRHGVKETNKAHKMKNCTEFCGGGSKKSEMDYSACVVSNDFEDLCEGGVDGGPMVGEGGAGRSRALHQGRLARRRGRLSGPLLGR
jgi:hypothetical protein